MLKLLDKNNIRIAIVPANCTDRLQPLDVSVNKSVKDYMRRQFQNWYQVCHHLRNSDEETFDPSNIFLEMSVVAKTS